MLPSILGGAQIVAGLFGSRNNPYAAQANQDLTTGRNYLTDLGGIGSQYGGLAQSAGADFGQDNGAYRTALGNEEQYLGTNPYSSAFGAGQVAGASGDTTQAFTAARAKLTNSLAARGLGQGGSAAGALSGLDAREAGAQSGLQDQVAQASIANQGQRLGQLASLEGGAANQDYGRQNAALGAEGGIDSEASRGFLGLGQEEQGLGLQYQGAQNAEIGSGAGMIASDYAMNNPPKWLKNPYGTGGQAAGSANPYGGPMLPGFGSAIPIPFSSFGSYGG